ncbi:hypothetical protein [Bacillus phage Saddex]|nr:hypothetical protein [Bacillus phage Saddex]
MVRYTRNRPLKQIHSLMASKYAGNNISIKLSRELVWDDVLDPTFKWNRHIMRTLSAAYWKGKRFNKKTGKANWKVRTTKVMNYVSYRANDNKIFGFAHIV